MCLYYVVSRQSNWPYGTLESFIYLFQP